MTILVRSCRFGTRSADNPVSLASSCSPTPDASARVGVDAMKERASRSGGVESLVSMRTYSREHTVLAHVGELGDEEAQPLASRDCADD